MKNIKYFTYILLTLLLSFSAVNAQVTKHNTKIKDGSVSNSSSVPNPNVILELESTAKGFLLPRMSDVQRDELTKKLDDNGNGVTIYNTTTDCINYWSEKKNEWMSLCGALPPATVDLNKDLCSSIKVTPADGKTLVQGKFLTPQDVLFVDLNVTAIGVYSISATTENGYYFSASGTFMNTGNMRIALFGVGTPIKGYVQGANGSTEGIGDIVTFNINGKRASSQCTFRSFVKKAAIEYGLVCTSNLVAQGKYMIGVPVKQKENFVDIVVDVKQPGAYRIKTESFNGVSFNGSGVFDKVEDGKIVRLYAEGVPTEEGEHSLSLETNSNTTIGNTCQIKLKIEDVDYKVDLSKSIVKGNFVQSEKLLDQTLAIAVEVIYPGTADFELESNGVVFAATNVHLEVQNNGDVQYVNLINNKAVLPLIDRLVFSKESNDTKFMNSYEIPLKKQPVTYSIDCSSVKVNTDKAILTPGIAMDEFNFVTLTVDVKAIGAYEIKTNVINGVSFSATGEFKKIGEQEVILKGNGAPENQINNVQYFIYTNSVIEDSKACGFKLSYKYHDINILVIGNNSYGPTLETKFTAGRILTSPNNFGPKGKVKVNSINITVAKNQSKYYDLQKLISSNNIDMVFVVYPGKITGDAINMLRDFVVDKKGVVVYSLENDKKHFLDFLEKVDKTTSNALVSTKYTMTNRISENIPQNIAVSSFGDLKGKVLGNDASNGSYFSGLGNNFIPIAYRDGDINALWAGMHTSLGLVFVGDGGWIKGTATNTSSSIFPSMADIYGNPIPKKNYGNTSSKGDVYNSLFFASIMEWGINYVLRNRK